MNPSRVLSTGLVLSGVVGVIDVLGVAGLAMDSAPPAWVAVLGAVLGVITLLALLPAWRGDTRAAAAVVVSRLLSVVLAVPAVMIDPVPGWARAAAAVVALLSLLGAGLVGAGVRRGAASLPPVAPARAHR
jgi:hypothetical protein